VNLVEVANETPAIVARGSYVAPSGAEVSLRAAIDAAVYSTVVYRPAVLDRVVARAHPVAGAAPPRIEVTGETTTEAGRRLVQAEGVERVLALNFASATRPGGGFLSGARAQEEDLARSSALYACLRDQHVYYDANRDAPSSLYTDHLIFSPGVPFFRDGRLRLLEAPFALTILTAPAPNAGVVRERDPALAPQLAEVLAARIVKLLAVAAVNGYRCLLLGAWGCGVFRNDPDAVAAAFANALAEPRFTGAFDRVVFAVFDPGGRNLGAFVRRVHKSTTSMCK
jgi:uncharacterized protein (TIGR02452 family)